MKLIITEHQVEKFAERMGYIDKVIKAQMREGDWEHLAWLIERYGLTQEDVDIIGMLQRNILESMVGQTIDSTDSRFSNIMHSDDEFTFTIDKVTPHTYNNASGPIAHRRFNLDMNLPRFVLQGSLVSYNKELENNQTWLDHVLDIMIEMVPESNPILKALGVNIDFDDYPVDYEGKDTVTPYNNLTEGTIKSKRDKINNLIKRLKKLYPKLDYCIGNDDTLQVYSRYEERADSGMFMEKGLIFDPIEPPSDFWRIGEFNDYREEETGEYVDRVVDMVDRSTEEGVIEWLDHEFGLDESASWGTPHYYGDPYGDEPMFDWRKCED
jgi:hypothetical protein